MKWLFFILLLANLGMFILIYPQKADKKVENILPDVGELYLYEELAELKTDASLSEETTLTGKEKQDAELVQETIEDRTKGEQPEQALEQITSNLSNDKSVPEVSTAEADIKAESERQIPVDEGDVAEEPSTVVAPVCRTIGYLESRSDAEIVSVSLRALGLKPELQSETSNEQAGIWVLIPPQATRREAINITNRLERDGVTDLWRFTSGDLVHAISLGLFRNEERAEARKREIAALGYDVIVKRRYRQKSKYWLYFQESTPSADSKKGWKDLLAKFPKLELNEAVCR
jgi:cell division protein FtsN